MCLVLAQAQWWQRVSGAQGQQCRAANAAGAPLPGAGRVTFVSKQPVVKILALALLVSWLRNLNPVLRCASGPWRGGTVHGAFSE